MRFGVGTASQMCILIDRGGQVLINGDLKEDAKYIDFVKMGRIGEIVQNMWHTLQRTSFTIFLNFFCNCNGKFFAKIQHFCKYNLKAQ